MRSSATDPPSLWATILAGGIGSRFWPVSTPSRPKQLLPLAGSEPLIRQTVERIRPLVPRQRIRVLTGRSLAEPLLGAAPELDRSQLLLEPVARGTAPALAWAAHRICQSDPEAVMISLHSDHVIEPAAAFREVLARVAAVVVEQDLLCTVGAVPTRADTGYGYISPGRELTADGAVREVIRFEEKPDAATAAQHVADGYLWNTGIFVWPAALLLAELRAHTPELAEHLPLLDAGEVEEYFRRVPTLSIDEGLLERSGRVAVSRAEFRWDDVGSWDAVGRNRQGDEHGNVAVGGGHFVDARNCITWCEAGAVVVFGADDLVVVTAGGTTFVAPRSRTPELKRLLTELPPELVEGGGA
jgi:mannose-1-phosphate guanylyltransferase